MTLANLDDYGVWIAGIAAGLAALGYLVKAFRKFARILEKLDHEVNHNSGKSIKDVTDWTKKALGEVKTVLGDVQSEQKSMREAFDAHLQTQAEANRAMWPAVKAIAEATPNAD